MFTYLFQVGLVVCLAFQAATALPTISVKGAKFFAGGQQFFLKGVAYQGTPTDPLVDANQCELDAKAMQSIGTNSIRVYHVDPNANHDGCMSTFHDAGIYVWLDLDTFNTTIVQEDPKWTPEQFYDFARVMDVFQSYENLAGFWIGNEVVFTADGASSAPFVKAAVADMKSYLSSKGYREIPIGYSAADIAELRPMLQNYLACGTKPEEAIDFFGLNSYEWCGDATYETSGYDILNTMSEGYSRPIFFSETGCNVGGSRTFNDQAAIFGPDMVNTWSGSIVYEWVQEANDYGLVTYPNGGIYNGAPIPLSPDFQNLADQWKKIDPVGISENSYSADISPPACPEASGGWPVDGDVPLPRLKSGIVEGAVATPTSQSSTILSSTTSTSATTSNSKVSKTGTDARSSSPSSTSKPSSSLDLSSSSTSPTSIFASAGSTSTISVSSSSTASTTQTSSPTSNTSNIPTTTSPSPAAATSSSAASPSRIDSIYLHFTLVNILGGQGGVLSFSIVATISIVGLGTVLS